MFTTVVPIAIGAMFGAVARYYVASLLPKIFGGTFPIGVLVCNILGTFLLGIFLEMGARWFAFPLPVRLAVVTGFLGSFTTFSAFSLETLLMLNRGQVFLAIIYVSASVILSLIALYASMVVVRGL